MTAASQRSGVSGLLDSGDDYVRKGDPKAAMSFYQAALKGAHGGPVDPETRERLRSAQQFIQQRAAEFAQSLDKVAASKVPGDQVSATRLRHAVEMLKGSRQIFPQQPSLFYYPYLAQRQFFEREEFDWVPALEAEAGAIREELTALIADHAAFRPYVEDDPDRPRRDFHGLNDNREWTALYLWQDGRQIEANAQRCPRTMEALTRVPLSRIGARTPAVFFSRLEAGAHIPPHTGMLNSRLICHLPLIVPKGCWLRVGNETREWEEGKLLIFDDSIEHEAKNPSNELRVVLIFDIWRPELNDSERDGISAIFDAIDQFQTLPAA